MGDDPIDHGPLSWRDVYKAVGDSEERIVKAIHDATKPIAERQLDHEARLRAIETGTLPWVNKLEVDAAATHNEQGRRIGDLETAVGTFRDRERGILSTLNFGQRLLLSAIAVVGIILSFLNFITIAGTLGAAR